MTALCIWIAGGVSSAVVSVVLPGRLVSSSPAAWLLALALSAAFVGALILRAILPPLAGASISYGWAAIALGLGSLAGNGVILVVHALVLSHAQTEVPVLWSNPAFALAATALGFLVSYWVIGLATSQPVKVEAARVPAEADDWYDTPSLGLGDAVVRTQDAVAQTCIAISRSPGDRIPGVVVDALTQLGTCAHGLQQTAANDPAVSAEIDRLLDALNRFQTSLTQIADDAAATGSDRMYQRGVLFGSMTDVSDGGALARYELNQADGLAAIRESFERLSELGVLPRVD